MLSIIFQQFVLNINATFVLFRINPFQVKTHDLKIIDDILSLCCEILSVMFKTINFSPVVKFI